MISLDDVASVLVILTICPLFAWLLREHVPSSWPRSLWLLAPVALVGSVFAVVGGGSGYLVRWVGRDMRVVVAVVVLAALTVVVTRASGGSWALAAWFAGCVLLIGVTTLPSASGAPVFSDQPGHQLRVCLTDPNRWLPPGLNKVSSSQLSSEFVPNIALFLPLGAGLVLALADRRHAPLATRKGQSLVLVVPLVTSMAIETYQALFTTRICAPIDVMTNALGGILGGLAVGGILAALRRQQAGIQSR